MPDAEQYRRFAEECLVMAEEEDNCGPRLSTLLEMAMTWMQLAQKANIDALAKAGSHQAMPLV
jgi:hypothetical protein